MRIRSAIRWWRAEARAAMKPLLNRARVEAVDPEEAVRHCAQVGRTGGRASAGEWLEYLMAVCAPCFRFTTVIGPSLTAREPRLRFMVDFGWTADITPPTPTRDHWL